MTYFNRRCQDGLYTFDSVREMARYNELKLMWMAGEISCPEVHPRYQLAEAVTLDGRKRRAIYYEADFTYRDWRNDGRLVVEDVKPKPNKDGKVFRTAVYKLKRHLMKASHGIEVVEVV